jgi:hypothetical protein
MANGEGCKCFARCENDCCCDVEWRSEREIELEAKVKELESEIAGLNAYIDAHNLGYPCANCGE